MIFDIYGKLNKDVIIKEYTGLNTVTANITTNNIQNKIKVDVIKTPGKLTIKQNNIQLDNFDGSVDKVININSFTTIYKTIFSNQEQDYIRDSGLFILRKEIIGLKEYDKIDLLPNNDFNQYDGQYEIINDILLFKLNSLPNENFTITYYITKCNNGGNI